MIFADKINFLRTKDKMSQQEFAEKFGVSRQAVQKWENGSSFPETPTLIEISKYFGVSVDNLLKDYTDRDEEVAEKEIIPYYENIHDWEFYGSSLRDEYRQSYDEGLDIEKYKDLFESVARLEKNVIKKELGDVLQRIVLNAPYREDYKYIEPSAHEDIVSFSKEYHYDKNIGAKLRDRIYGAWMGRICGCMLGKTVEGVKSDELKKFLKQTDNYPMSRYIFKSDLEKVDLQEYNYGFINRPYADCIDYMPFDDDTNYTIISQNIIDKYGVDFTPGNVASEWTECQPKSAYCTAERVAFCNFIKGYCPPDSAIHKNAYREWIGAQIRGDYWGYINPGNPKKAAEMAWRDASISHVKNGIYGEMFVAAMLATAAETNNIRDIILSGISHIPHTSRLYESVMKIYEDYINGKSAKECFAYIHSRYDECTSYGWCHTISNAMIVVASLLYGNGDFGKSICMAVETGFDTDCNGATVGSILGMAKGIGSIGEEWTKPFNGTLETTIFGMGKVRIKDCVDKTMQHIDVI